MVLATDKKTIAEVENLPAPLRESVLLQLQKIDALEAPPEIPATHIATLIRMLACSEFAAAVFLREADWLLTQDLSRPPSISQLQDFVAQIGQSDQPQNVVQSEIRKFRNRYFLHVLWREFDATATLNETLYAISDLADGLLKAAAEYAHRAVRERCGVVRDENGDEISLVVLGMGKLGGRELNFSSDIDVIFLHPDGSDSDGDRSLSPHEYFARVGRRIISLAGRANLRTASRFASIHGSGRLGTAARQ